MKACSGSRGVTPLILNLDTKWRRNNLFMEGGGGGSLAPAHSNKHCELGFISLRMTPELLMSIHKATATE